MSEFQWTSEHSVGVEQIDQTGLTDMQQIVARKDRRHPLDLARGHFVLKVRAFNDFVA